MRARPERWLLASGVFAAGGFWGLGLAGVLAFECYSAFLYSFWGAMCAALACGAVSFLTWIAFVRRGAPPGRAALRLAPLGLPLLGLLLGPAEPWQGPALLLGALGVTVAAHTGPSLPAWAEWTLAGAVPLAIYLPDVAPWVGRADTFEFQVVAPRLGVAHPSGYPLYILLGKVFSLLPFGTIAWRVNLSSAVCAALAACCMDRTLRAAHQPSGVALLMAWTLALTPTLWSRAVEAEVYALNALIVVLGLWVAVRWQTGSLPARRALPLLGLLVGLGLASHLTLGAMLLLLVPLASMLRPRPSWSSLLAAGGLLVLGLGLYFYIPLRWPALNDGRTMDLGSFARYVTNAESGGALHPMAFIDDPARWVTVWRMLRTQVGWVGLALAAVGLAVMVRAGWWPLAVGTGAAFGAWVWFGLSFYVAEPDYSAFLVPAHVIVVLWAGVGMGWAAKAICRHAAAFMPVALAAAALLPLSRLWLTGPGLDTARERADDAWGRYALSRPLARGAAVLADSEKFPPLYYLQQIEGLRPDLDLIVRFDESGYREELQRRVAAGQIVYLARYLPHLEGYFLRSVGPLIEVHTAPPEERLTPTISTAIPFGQSIRLLGFDAEQVTDPYIGSRFTLYWFAASAPQADLLVYLRLADEAGRVAWASDGARPVGGLYPTAAWPAGETVVDYHELAVPDYILPGVYSVQVALLPAFAAQGEGTWATLTTIDVPPRTAIAPLSVARRALFGSGVWLTGYDLPAEARAGGRAPVTLGWRADGSASEFALVLSWVDRAGRRTVASDPTEPLDLAGLEQFQVRQTVTVPSEPGEYELRLQWTDRTDMPVQARCSWLASPADGCILGSLAVLPDDEGLANFGDLILLTDARAHVADGAPRRAVELALEWRALQTMREDYTLFVQLIGTDGRLYGQIDTWPVQGSYPTSQWKQGETIAERVTVQLEPGAPAGTYRVAVGWYLLATMQRLPVVDASGRTIADLYWVAQFDLGG